jgi:cytochrome c oxidase assembly protein subunit 11
LSTPAPEVLATTAARRRSNGAIALACAAVFVAMVGAAFASVPLYRAFCQATGFAGAVSRASVAPSRILAQRVTVTFDTNVRGLPWVFAAEQRSQQIHIGDTGLAFFTVANTGDRPITGHAVYNISPDQAGAYFHKLQCFCFTDQTIPAHTTVRFPVVYFVDPQFARDSDTRRFTDLTLSYTFYPAVVAAKPASNGAGPLGGSGAARL